MTFADRYPLASFLELLSIPDEARDEHVLRNGAPEAMAHLAAARDAGLMTRISGSRGRRIRLVDAWNAFAEGRPQDEEYLAWTMGFTFILGIVTARFGAQREGSAKAAESAHRGICEAFDRGDMRYNTPGARFRFDSIMDEIGGDFCELVIEGWKGELRAFDLRQDRTVVLPDLIGAPLTHLDIDLPTGDLMMADWFRIDAFTKAVDRRLDARLSDRRSGEQYNVASQIGAVNLAEAHLEDAGILRIAADDGSVVVDVAEGDDRLVASRSYFPGMRGDRTQAPEGHRRAGTIDCAHHAVMVADRAQLVLLLAEGGDATPEATIDRYMDENSYTVRTKVEPGRWRIHFGPDFHRRANRRKLGIPKGISPWFTMERIGDVAPTA